MGESKLKTAVLGLNEGGRFVLEAAKGVDFFEIQAVADKDTNLVERIAERYGCAWFDDYRQLIIQNQLDCLLVAAGMHSCDEYVRAAMKKKFNVLKLAPAARDFEEAVELVRLSEEENIKFAVANPRRFSRGYLSLREYLQRDGVEQVFLVTAFCSGGTEPCAGWQTDPKLGGGGVLLHNCYWIIDQMVYNFDVPEQIYMLGSNHAQDKQQRLYLTEDTSVVTMKFGDKLIGNIVASRQAGIGAEEECVKLYGKDKILTVSEKEFTISDGAGRVSDEMKYEDDAFYGMREQLRNFARSILSPDENKVCSSCRENLENMAVIESAYVSARTGFPEEPGKVLQMAPVRADEPTST
jgi:predicted dehydrogenase